MKQENCGPSKLIKFFKCPIKEKTCRALKKLFYKNINHWEYLKIIELLLFYIYNMGNE